MAADYVLQYSWRLRFIMEKISFGDQIFGRTDLAYGIA